jgi:predicted protein tyrosine phosphatase
VNVLFVCSLNRARSVAAERLYRGTPGLSVRSAGIDDRATHRVNEADLAWADRVFNCEREQATWIRAMFAGDLPDIIELGIPDEYTADDPELIRELLECLEPYLGIPGKRPHQAR